MPTCEAWTAKLCVLQRHIQSVQYLKDFIMVVLKDPMWKTPQLTLPNLTCRCISFSDGYIKKFTSFKIFVKV